MNWGFELLPQWRYYPTNPLFSLANSFSLVVSTNTDIPKIAKQAKLAK
jgi:hypothetical protein